MGIKDAFREAFGHASQKCIYNIYNLMENINNNGEMPFSRFKSSSGNRVLTSSSEEPCAVKVGNYTYKCNDKYLDVANFNKKQKSFVEACSAYVKIRKLISGDAINVVGLIGSVAKGGRSSVVPGLADENDKKKKDKKIKKQEHDAYVKQKKEIYDTYEKLRKAMEKIGTAEGKKLFPKVSK